MNKRKRAQLKIINSLSLGPVILLPFVYWCLVQLDKFQEWQWILLAPIPIGLLINWLVLLVIRRKNPEILNIKNGKNFKLGHYTGAIAILLSLFIFTAINVYVTIETTVVEYKINKIGERGSGRNKSSYVEIMYDNGHLEKIALAKYLVKSLEGKDSIQLIRNKSFFGLVSHDKYSHQKNSH
ncbi:MAG: hypothetical protein NXI20_00780 [bacterium]|nr:hypothetical protein [bacterium]